MLSGSHDAPVLGPSLSCGYDEQPEKSSQRIHFDTPRRYGRALEDFDVKGSTGHAEGRIGKNAPPLLHITPLNSERNHSSRHTSSMKERNVQNCKDFGV
eukprot:275987-Amphidinium_carterae.1